METGIEIINQLTGGLIRGGVSTLSSATNSILNSLYPKEFELYMLSLELTTFDDSPIDYLTFPVNPDSLTKVEPKIKDISRSYGAVIVTKTDTFVPQDLVIRGNFGKSFKFLNREDSAAGIVNMFKGMIPSFEGELSKYWKSAVYKKPCQHVCACLHRGGIFQTFIKRITLCQNTYFCAKILTICCFLYF